jgi:hypothetical protein
MVASAVLLQRLDAIGQALRDSGQGLALLGLGSVGLETARIDTWSDLDFFAIVEPGSKARYLHRLDWLAAARPLAWHFQNTRPAARGQDPARLQQLGGARVDGRLRAALHAARLSQAGANGAWPTRPSARPRS